jgi:hypothetical protein
METDLAQVKACYSHLTDQSSLELVTDMMN